MRTAIDALGVLITEHTGPNASTSAPSSPSFPQANGSAPNTTNGTHPTTTKVASYTRKYAKAPPVEHPYVKSRALEDLSGISYALDLFLASKMVEAEDYCNEEDPEKYVYVPLYRHGVLEIRSSRQRLYFATGYGLIQCVKALMSYADEVHVFPTIKKLF